MPKRNEHRIAALETLIHSAILKSASNHHIVEFMEIGSKIVNSVKALRDMDAKPNPSESENGHSARMATAAGKLNGRVTHLEALLFGRLKSQQDDIAERITTKVNLTPDAKYEAEIRAVFRSLTNTKQLELLKQFATANDGPSIAAICCCPNTLSGTTSEIQARYKSHIQSLHAPDEMRDSKELLEALQPFLSMANVARDFAADYGNPIIEDPTRAALVARDKEAARVAMLAFEAAIPEPTIETTPEPVAAAA